MDNFKIIYRILKVLEKSMDYDEIDTRLISAEALNISQNRWNSIMEMLAEEGYVKGINIITSEYGASVRMNGDFRITLKGLEYLSENSIMKKTANIIKGIAESVPFP